MNKKFPYGYDVEAYIDKAIEKMQDTYPWATRDLFNKRYDYAIEKKGKEYEYISIYHWDDRDEKKVLKCDVEEFLDTIIYDNEFSIQEANKVKSTYKMPGQEGKSFGGWYLEDYTFRTHELGGYSVFCQTGDRVTGGSRTFFIPNSYFKGSYDEFLDRYIKLVPPSFGFTREELAEDPKLKKFLGF